MKSFIAIAGNIGVGKSTLVKMMEERLGWQPFYEAVVENPSLSDFYQDMPRWAFQSQVFFLTRRLHSHRSLLDAPGVAVQDRSVYEDAEIFARNLYQQGRMSNRDYGSYRELYEAMALFLPPPDLVVYLRASVPTLMHRIVQRGRSYEQGISADYLEQLNVLYEDWAESFSQCPMLIFPADHLDFVWHDTHLEFIAEKVVQKLSGKEIVKFESTQ